MNVFGSAKMPWRSWLRDVVAHDELGAHDRVGLGIAAAFEVARIPQSTHLGVEGGDDGLQVRFLVGLGALLGQRVALVAAALVDAIGDPVGQAVLEQGVEGGTEERVDPSLDAHERP